MASPLGTEQGRERLRKLPALLDKDFRIKIQRCSDPHMWYADKVGQWIRVERWDVDGIWAREPAGYINIIRFEDVE